MFEAVRNALRLPELRRKLLYTGLIILIYQFAAHVPVPGVNRQVLAGLLQGEGSSFINILDLLSGGAVSNFSVIANGVYPFITASIIFQLLTPVVPSLERLQKEPGGQDKLNQYQYYLAIPMAIFQSVGQINIFERFTQGNEELIAGFGSDPLVTISTVATMTAGTMFAIWLGDLITEQGIGNGLSIIIFSGIVARVPENFIRLLQVDQTPLMLYNLVVFALLTLITVIVIVYIQEGVRRVPVQYGRRVRGMKQYGGGSTHVPLRVNTAGMIPLIFAQSITVFPSIIASFFPAGDVGRAIQDTFGQQSGFIYWATYFILVLGFTFFYTSVMVENQALGENLQKQGGFIPGIRPGKRTQDHINRIVNRITFVGALFLAVVAIMPGIIQLLTGIFFGAETTASSINPAQVITGSGLIIVVGVVIDTIRQLEAQLVMRNYEGFL